MPKSLREKAEADLARIDAKYAAPLKQIKQEMKQRRTRFRLAADAYRELLNGLYDQHALPNPKIELVEDDDDYSILRPPASRIFDGGEAWLRAVSTRDRLVKMLPPAKALTVSADIMESYKRYRVVKLALPSEILVEHKGRTVSYQIVDRQRYQELCKWLARWQDGLRRDHNVDPVIVPPAHRVQFNPFTPENEVPIEAAVDVPLPDGGQPRGTAVPGSHLLRDYCGSCAEPIRVTASDFDPKRRPTCSDCGDGAEDRPRGEGGIETAAFRHNKPVITGGMTVDEIGRVHQAGLRTLVGSLNSQQHKLLIERFIKGRPEADLASEEGVTVDAIEARVATIRRAFRTAGLPRPIEASDLLRPRTLDPADDHYDYVLKQIQKKNRPR